jgi:hypothetical protein
VVIATNDQYIGAARQSVRYMKTASRTATAGAWYSLFELAGQPGAGTLAVGNTANGVVPTDATAGFPLINAFGGAAIGYLGAVDFASSVACRIRVYDCLFAAGAYAFNANTTLASQPSYAARLPGTDYKGAEIWVEQVTAATGNQAVSVTYLDENAASSVTGAVGIGAAPLVGRCWQLPLAAGDRGVQRIDNVTGSVATVGTFNVRVLRGLWNGRVQLPNDGDTHSYLKTHLQQLFDTSALYVLVSPDSTATGLPDLELEIVNG